MPATKSAVRGSPSAAPATKSALRGSQALCLPRNLHFEVHKVLCLPRNLHFEVHKVLRVSRNLHFKVHQVLRLPRNLHFEVHKVLRLPRNLQTSHISRSHDSLHLSRNSELVEDHHHIQSAALATKSAFPSKAAPIPCTCHEKSTLDHQNTKFPLHPPRKVTTMSENAHGTTTRAQSLEAPAAHTQISRACAIENACRRFREA